MNLHKFNISFWLCFFCQFLDKFVPMWYNNNGNKKQDPNRIRSSSRRGGKVRTVIIMKYYFITDDLTKVILMTDSKKHLRELINQYSELRDMGIILEYKIGICKMK